MKARTMKSLEDRCREEGLLLTPARRVIVEELRKSTDHPDALALLARARDRDPSISQATVYRTVRVLQERGLIKSHDFGDGRARFEDASNASHDHMIDLETGDIIEFSDPEFDAMKQQIANRLGFDLRSCRVEFYGTVKS